jgi:hypothetical protein
MEPPTGCVIFPLCSWAHNTTLRSRRERRAIVHSERRALLLRAPLSIVGLGSTGHLDLNYSGLDGATDDLKFRNRDGKFESTRARTSWIDVEDPIALLYRWLVRVSRHNYLKPSSHGIDIQLGQIVQDVYEDILDFKDFGF